MPRRIAAVLVTLLALLAAARLVTPQETTGVRGQLTFLRAQLDTGAAEDAQHPFPEGYFFLYALYGLAQVGQGNASEARWALSRLESPAGREPFDADLTPAYGVFYQGWTNWLRGGILSASLRLHDKLLPPRYAGTIDRWLTGVRQRLDPATGLMPHTVDVASGAPASGARGTSQSIIQRFLVDIDPAFGRSQYLRFRSLFLVHPLGLGPAIREYPAGTDGPADVDSGPLPLGVSLSASAVTLGAAAVQGDEQPAGALANYGELIGVPVSTPSSAGLSSGAGVDEADAGRGEADDQECGAGPQQGDQAAGSLRVAAEH
jgi:hypothetical protein